MFLSNLRKSIVGVFLLGLVSCSTPDATIPKMTFSHLGQINLNVKTISMLSQENRNSAYPRVDHKFPISPHQAVEKWAKDRLTAGGIQRTARITILEAKATETRIQNTRTLTDVFKLNASEKYYVSVSVKIEIIDTTGLPLATAISNADWTQTVREDISPTSRRRKWFTMTEKTMEQFNKKMEESIFTYLSEFIKK